MPKLDVLIAPGWVRLDPANCSQKDIAAAARAMVRKIPVEVRDPMRGYVMDMLDQQIRAMGEQGVISYLFSADEAIVSPLRSSIVIIPFTGDDEKNAVGLAIEAAGLTGAKLVESRGMLGVRLSEEETVEYDVSGKIDSLPKDIVEMADLESLGAEQTSISRINKKFTYLLGNPEVQQSWVAVLAQVSARSDAEGAEEAIAAVGDFFDAWIRTVSWTGDFDDSK